MFKVGEILICIDEPRTEIRWKHVVNLVSNGVTLGNRYETIKPVRRREGYVHIRNDRGETQDYQNKYFISLQQCRKLKIEKICSKLEI